MINVKCVNGGFQDTSEIELLVNCWAVSKQSALVISQKKAKV